MYHMTVYVRHLGEVQLSDFAADVLCQAAGEADHARQLHSISLDQLQVGSEEHTKTQFISTLYSVFSVLHYT